MCRLTLTAGLCLVIASLASSSSPLSLSPFKLVCYYDSSAERRVSDGCITVGDIDSDLCTHLIYGISYITNQYQLPRTAWDIQHYRSFNALKIRNPQLKTVLSVGDLSFNTQKFSTMMATRQNRAIFIQSVISLLRFTGFDGLNLDWNKPGGIGSRPQDKQRFTLLCKELKRALVAEAARTHRGRLIATASVSAEKATIDACYEVAQIATHLDFINVLTFDFHGLDNIYSNTNYALRYWQAQGAPAYKLNIGLAAYGGTFHLSSSSSEIRAPGPARCLYTNEGLCAFHETCLYAEDDTIQFIEHPVHSTSNNQLVGFGNQQSLDNKVSYLIRNGYGGAFAWSLDLDDFRGCFCKQGKYPFISHLHTLLVPGFPATYQHFYGNLCKKPNGHFANPADPTTFVNCARGVAHIQPCPVGLVFKEFCHCCTYPSTPTTTPLPDQYYGNPCIRGDGNYANPEDPTTFFICSNGRAYILDCPANLVFEESCNCCNYSSTFSTSGDSRCNGQLSGYFAHHTDSQKYYNCDHGVAHEQMCPDGLVFKQSLPGCDYPTTEQIIVDCRCKGQLTGHFAHPIDPQKYYNCDHGVAHEQKCSKGLVFKQYPPRCDYPTTDQSTVDSRCNGQLRGYFAHPTNPQKYYNCDHGIAHEQMCPAGLVFKQYPPRCDYPTTEQTTVDSNCNGQLTGYFAHPTNPQKYYNCDHGVANEQMCSAGLVFKQTPPRCDHPTTTTTTEHITVDSNCNGQLTGYFAHTNPQKYYNCAHGVAYEQMCSAGLVFKQNPPRCDYPTTTTTTGHITVDSNCYGQLTGYFAHPTDPQKYYNCDHGVAHEQMCSKGLIFKQYFACFEPPTTTPTTTTVATTLAPRDPCVEPNGHFANPADPSTFFNCANGVAHRQPCPGGLTFQDSCHCCR